MTTATILQERMKQIEAVSLKKGDHGANAELQMCVMEAVAYVAGEPWADHPQCACPVITDFCISWNDSLRSDAERDRLLITLPERRACPSEIKQVIPAYVISECEAMDAKLRDEEQKAMARRFESPRITAMGELA